MKDSLFNLAMRKFERRFLLNSLNAFGWNRKATARFLKMSYRNLLYRIERLKIAPGEPSEYE